MNRYVVVAYHLSITNFDFFIDHIGDGVRGRRMADASTGYTQAFALKEFTMLDPHNKLWFFEKKEDAEKAASLMAKAHAGWLFAVGELESGFQSVPSEPKKVSISSAGTLPA